MIKQFLLSLSATAILSSTLLAEPLEVEAKLPEVTAMNHEGEEVATSDYAEKEWLLVFFYPKAGTGG